MERLLEIGNKDFLRSLCGVADRNLKAIEQKIGVSLLIKSHGLQIAGKEGEVKKAAALISRLQTLFKEGVVLQEEEVAAMASARSGAESEPSLRIPVPSAQKKFIFPKTPGQREYVKAMKKSDITFAIGPAGTGKTYCAMAMAVNALMKQKVSRLILTRPAIEAGESLGFLPGDMQAKLGPYLRPLYDALYDMIEADTIEEYLETGIVEIVPLAYMRGRTLNNAFIILDEAQNCTSEQLKMFLTRLGFDSRAVITGDITQSDLPGGKPLGLLKALDIVKPIEGITTICLTQKDVVRHPLIQKIIEAYEKSSGRKKEGRARSSRKKKGSEAV